MLFFNVATCGFMAFYGKGIEIQKKGVYRLTLF
jgi:hypothetical protein